MVYRKNTLSIIAAFAVLALFGGWGCDTGQATFRLDQGNVDRILEPVVCLQVIPVRWEYPLEGGSLAKTEEHLHVFAVYYNGDTHEVPLRDTEVILEEAEPITLIEEEPYPFTSSGGKTLTVSFSGKEIHYTIMVRSSVQSIPDYPTDTPSTGSGITIDII